MHGVNRYGKKTYSFLRSLACDLTDLACLLDHSDNVNDAVRINALEIAKFNKAVLDLRNVFCVGAL
jgi:hypothetical protein